MLTSQIDENTAAPVPLTWLMPLPIKAIRAKEDEIDAPLQFTNYR